MGSRNSEGASHRPGSVVTGVKVAVTGVVAVVLGLGLGLGGGRLRPTVGAQMERVWNVEFVGGCA